MGYRLWASDVLLQSTRCQHEQGTDCEDDAHVSPLRSGLLLKSLSPRWRPQKFNPKPAIAQPALKLPLIANCNATPKANCTIQVGCGSVFFGAELTATALANSACRLATRARSDPIESVACHTGLARSARAGTQGQDLRACFPALGTGYFALAKFRHDSGRI